MTSAASFADFAFTAPLPATLTALNYITPTPIQAQAMPAILAGRDVLAGAQTGTGKTAAFLLPLLQRWLSAPAPGLQFLVLAPTRELAQQVQAAAQRYSAGSDFHAAAVVGGASYDAQIAAVNAGAHLVVATPGRLLDLLKRNALKLTHLTALVLDEADRLLDLGFSDELNAILRFVPKTRQTLLFSATFDAALHSLSRHWLRDPLRIAVADMTPAPLIEQRVYVVDKARKTAVLAHLLQQHQPALIFSRTRQTCDQLSHYLTAQGVQAAALHGDLSQNARERVLAEFRQGQWQALVATDIAARGLDIKTLSTVINVELPFAAEDYVHRCGRVGRAGQAGLAITLFSHDDAPQLGKVEMLLDIRLPQQWLPGFEPDLSAELDAPRPRKGAQKQRARQQALGKKARR
ncbi:MAG: DEAD/DEAH box helicase [Aeromonas sp.]